MPVGGAGRDTMMSVCSVSQECQFEATCSESPSVPGADKLVMVFADELRNSRRGRRLSRTGQRIVTKIHEIAQTICLVTMLVNEHIGANVSRLSPSDRLSSRKPCTDCVLPNHAHPWTSPAPIGDKKIGDATGVSEICQATIFGDQLLTSLFIQKHLQFIVHLFLPWGGSQFATRGVPSPRLNKDTIF